MLNNLVAITVAAVLLMLPLVPYCLFPRAVPFQQNREDALFWARATFMPLAYQSHAGKRVMLRA